MSGSTFGPPPSEPPPTQRLLCAYHPEQPLTNFCTHSECLMPLCPCCLVEHTQEHQTMRQPPQYLQLNQAIEQAKERTYQQVCAFEGLQTRNHDISNYLAGLEEYVGKQLAQCKIQIVGQVEEAFQIYEQEILAAIRKKYASDGVYDVGECSEVAEYIAGEIERLYGRVVDLKGEDCLGVLIRQHEVEDAQVARGIQQVEKYIQTNSQAGGINITLDPEKVLPRMTGLLRQTIALKFVPTSTDLHSQSASPPRKKSWFERNIKAPPQPQPQPFKPHNGSHPQQIKASNVSRSRKKNTKIKVESRVSAGGTDRGKMEYSRIEVGDLNGSRWQQGRHF